MEARLRELATGKGQLEPRLAEVAALSYQQVAPDAVLSHGLQLLTGPPRLMESDSLEGREDLVRAFIEGITVKPGEGRLVVQMKKLPARGKLLPGAVSVSGGSGGTLLSRKDIPLRARVPATAPPQGCLSASTGRSDGANSPPSSSFHL